MWRAKATSALLLAAAGCGGGDGNDLADRPPRPLPACASSAAAIARPPGLPESFPVPPGTRLTKQRTPFEGQVVVEGVVPASLDEAAGFFEAQLEDSGYQPGRREAEPGEAEGLFTGKDLRGGWRVNVIDGCEGASALTIVIIRL